MLRVRLAGSEAVWYPAAGRQLVEWLETGPWDSTGGTHLVRASGPIGWSAIVGAVGFVVRSLEQGSGVRVLSGGVNGSRLSPERVIGSVLGMSADLSARDWINIVGRLLDVDRCVIALDALGVDAGEVQRLRSGIEEVGSSLRKSRSDVALTVLVGHNTPTPQSWPLDVALPEHADLDARTEAAKWWSHYLHQRLAWESGGHLDRAVRWETTLAESRLGLGDDDALERLLNEWAADEWKHTDEVDRTALSTFAHALNRDAGTGARASLQSKRLVWDPSGVPQLVPWVARATLREGSIPLRRWARSSLVCGLLRKELLQHCLELEGLARGLLLRALPQTPPDETRDALRAFTEGRARSNREWYPAMCPAVPGDEWDVADFGTILAQVPLSVDLKNLLHDLRRVRNALAHGHYVNWAMVSALGTVERKMRERVGW